MSEPAGEVILYRSDDGKALVRAQGWRLRTEKVSFEAPSGSPEPPPGPDRAEPGTFPDIGYDVGYHTAMDYRFTEGAFIEPGPEPAPAGLPVAIELLP